MTFTPAPQSIRHVLSPIIMSVRLYFVTQGMETDTVSVLILHRWIDRHLFRRLH